MSLQACLHISRQPRIYSDLNTKHVAINENIIIAEQKFIDDNLWFFMIGKPNKKLLHEWIFTLDLKRINFYLKDVINIRNFVVKHTHYTKDKEVYGVKDYWLQSKNEMYEFLRNKKDDCDAITMLTAALIHSTGNPDVQLALGFYGNPKYAVFPNHLYCLLVNKNEPDNPYVIDTTGDDIINILPKLSDLPYYTTFVSCNAKGEYYLYNLWKTRYENTM